MSTFDFLSVLFSVVVGLALTEILQGFRALIHARQRVSLYWPAILWGGLMIVIVAQAWWGMFAMRALAHWNFAMYGAVVLQITLMYLAAGVCMPEVPKTEAVDMRAAYFANKSWFFGLLAVTVAATIFKDYILIGHLTSGGNLIFLLVYCIAAIIAAATNAGWYHWILAPFAAIGILVYSALLSFRL
jgi:hypothetical protein